MKDDTGAEIGDAMQISEFVRLERRRVRRPSHELPDDTGPFSYLMKLGRATVRLSPVEFRLLRLLAGRPYQAFSCGRIAEAISTDREPVREEEVEQHVATLRQKLGFYADYVQRVKYLGYCFKP